MYYFASDIHLGAGDEATARRIEARFVGWLDSISCDADAVFLLGDLFDFWFEYGKVVPKGFVRTLAKLAELTSRGVRVVFFTGNHDMWVGDYLHKECGVEVHTSPKFMELAGRQVFLAHGDNIRVDDQPMLKLMNTVFRSKVLRFLFSWLVHPDLALRFGQWWSGHSRKSHGAVIERSMLDPLVGYADELAASRHLDCCIFGHMHLAADIDTGHTRVIFLGEWETAPAYAVMDDNGELTLKYLKTE